MEIADWTRKKIQGSTMPIKRRPLLPSPPFRFLHPKRLQRTKIPLIRHPTSPKQTLTVKHHHPTPPPTQPPNTHHPTPQKLPNCPLIFLHPSSSSHILISSNRYPPCLLIPSPFVSPFPPSFALVCFH